MKVSEAYRAGWKDACKAIYATIYGLTADCHCHWIAEDTEDECPNFEENENDSA